LLWTEQAQTGDQRFEILASAVEFLSGLVAQALPGLSQGLLPLLEVDGWPYSGEAVGQVLPAGPLLSGALPDTAQQPSLRFIEPLQPVVKPPPRMKSRQSLGGLRKE
jgi:hypothetical protein